MAKEKRGARSGLDVGMDPPSVLARPRQRLLQIGMGLLVYSSLDGFAIPHLGSPRIGLSVHTLSAYQGVLLLTQGFLWTRLKFGVTASWVAFWCLLHGTLAILAAYTVAAVWGVGNGTIQLMGELPHGLSHGTVFQETLIQVLAYSSAPTGLAWLALVLWGLRMDSERP
jgi:hydroxylaminobenzene mutase